MMFVWIVFVDIEYWKIWGRCEWLDIVFILIEYL